MTRSEGEKQGSALLKANAWHHRSDAVSSVVALIGVGELSHLPHACMHVPFIVGLNIVGFE